MTTLKSEPLYFAHHPQDIQAFTLLRGTVDASDNYSSVNLCDYTGDNPVHVAEGRNALCRSLGIPAERLIMPRQTHSSHVAVIDTAFLSLSADARSLRLHGVDALVSSVPDVAIGVNTADCVPIALCDATAGIIAIAHAGWRGTVARIAAATVARMVELGARMPHVQAAIGASICPACFEVGDEVVREFADAGFAIDHVMHRNASTGKAHIDLWKANRQVLLDSGLETANIAISGNCTRCHPSKYFSARRLGIHSGRTFTFIIRR